ncbi:MBL fold metallo-hydrolase [Aestuariimicrobium sp. T2.26MG-19.2B]|uniref:MBL fold metallo-hydrolase n=1 Tax=Aestuariimicrobium sp. T2.26MG-19.2B TaxID=3040679 RepID=UPI002477C3D1|nr:MBL fold metallo-hydrolase [Aestuariimicrobium sp. T2.26MG-19.2B]CAI9404621.1 Hydroxyacylglutathione hydrolase [Aestuariimicrobium sp. T2.26MG-19.2B]
MSARIDHTVTSGTFSLDGETFDVDNNVWVLGDDHECVVIDAPHDDAAIAELVAGRKVLAVLLTHGHDDHIRATRELTERVGAPAWLHPDDRMLWDLVFPDLGPDAELADGQVIPVAGVEVQVLHTPGHSPGACCFHVPALGVVFSGDTLFRGGPGATGRSWSSFETIVDSIQRRLLSLPASTVVHTGHGESTTIADEAPHVQEWIARGH